MSVVDDPDRLPACLEVAGDWLAVGLDPRPERLAAFPWKRPTAPTVDDARRRAWSAAASDGSSSATARPVRTSICWLGSSGRTMPTILVAGGASDPTTISRIRDTGVAGLILGESLLSGAIDFPAALEAAA